MSEKMKEIEQLTSNKKRKALFSTAADLHRDVDPEAYVIYSMRDFAIYLIFLVLTVTIGFGSMEPAHNYYSNILSEIITNSKFPSTMGMNITLKNIHLHQDIWPFINNVLIKVFYDEYDNFSSSDNIDVLQGSILFSAPQMRQIRVKNETCKTAPLFDDIYKTCHDYFRDDVEETVPFGLGTTAWIHNPPRSGNLHYTGHAALYPGGGYVLNFTTDPNFTIASIEELSKNGWISLGTRAILMDFATYTPNTNLFCVVKLVFEMIPSGGVLTSWNFYTLKLLRYVTPWDYFIFACEVVFICYVICYALEEITQILILRERYLANWWNILDFLIVLCSFTVIGLGICQYIFVDDALSKNITVIFSNYHFSFDTLVRVANTLNIFSAILTFLVWIKLLKFSTLNRSVTLILSTFGHVKLEFIALIFMMLTMVIGFAILANVTFGAHVFQFRSIWESFFTLLGLVIGGLYFYDDCAYAAPILAPIYFAVYIFLLLMFTLSAAVALIVFGFFKANNAIDENFRHVYIGDGCKQFINKFLQLLKWHRLAKSFQERNLSEIHMKDYEALLNILRRHGHRGLNLELLLNKHGIHPGKDISLEKMLVVYNDLHTRNQLIMEAVDHDKLVIRINKLTNQIESMNQTLSDVIPKSDLLVNIALNK